VIKNGKVYIHPIIHYPTMKLKNIKQWYTSCTGNTCRSPLLQRILMAKLDELKIEDFNVNSRIAEVEESTESTEDILGYLGHSGGSYQGNRLSSGTKELILHIFNDENFVESHRAKEFTREELAKADIVITMDHHHKDSLTEYFEAFTEDKKCKVYALGELVGRPHEAVKDPFSLDMQMFEELYQKETGIDLYQELEFEDKIDAYQRMKQQEKKVLHHFSHKRKREIRVKAYMSTYTQLDSMVTELFEKEKVKFNTIEELFNQEMLRDYDNWIWQESIKKKQSQRRGKKYSVHYCNKKTNPEQQMFNMLRTIVSVYRATVDISGSKKLETSYNDFLSTIEEKVAKMFISKSEGKYETIEAVQEDYKERIGEEIGPHLISLAEKIPKLMAKCDKEGALTLRMLAYNATNIAEQTCSHHTTDKIYKELIQKKITLDKKK